MTDQEAVAMIGERAEELAKDARVQKKMVEIGNSKGKEEAEKYLYNLAIATLMGN